MRESFMIQAKSCGQCFNGSTCSATSAIMRLIVISGDFLTCIGVGANGASEREYQIPHHVDAVPLKQARASPLSGGN